MPLTTLPDLGPSPSLGYARSPLDRAAHLRNTAAELLTSREARVYLLGGELVAARRLGDWLDPLFDLAHAQTLGAQAPLFLGLVEGAPRFAMRFDPGRREALEQSGLFVSDLRAIGAQGLLPQDHLGPLACGKAMLGWHGRHRFCANCGGESRIVQGGWRRDCPACGAQHFPRTDPVVIMLIHERERCLMARQPHFPPGMWSALAGFVEPGETPEDAVRREVMEEAGVRVGEVHYHAAQPWPFPMSLMIGCHGRAESTDLVIDHSELETARWFTREEAHLMLARQHPDGLFTPPPHSIAHHLVRAYVLSTGRPAA